MGVNFTFEESRALYGLLAEDTADIVVKTDRDGFVVHASPAIRRLGLLPASMLIGPHILDLVHPSCRGEVEAAHAAVLGGHPADDWIEFPAIAPGRREHWFAIRLRCLRDERGAIYGALGVMRSIEERRAFEERLFAASLTDPLTGLTNRPAFVAMLGHLVDNRTGGCLAIFSIDHMKAINMQFGQAVGDEVLISFADLLRMMMRSTDIISRIGGESLGVLLPGADPGQAEAICQRIVEALAESRQPAGQDGFAITASGGVARIAGSLDDTIRRAELALFLAKAKGRNRLEIDGGAGR